MQAHPACPDTADPGRAYMIGYDSEEVHFSGAELAALYTTRFSADERKAKRALWEALCRGFFDRYVRPSDTVLDLGAGSCEFVNAIRAKEKIAVDLNPET